MRTRTASAPAATAGRNVNHGRIDFMVLAASDLAHQVSLFLLAYYLWALSVPGRHVPDLTNNTFDMAARRGWRLSGRQICCKRFPLCHHQLSLHAKFLCRSSRRCRYLYAKDNARRVPKPQEALARTWFRAFFEEVDWDLDVEVQRIYNHTDMVRIIAWIAKEWGASAKAHVSGTGAVMYTAQIKSLRARNPGLSRAAAKKLVEKFIGSDQGFQAHHNAQLPPAAGGLTQADYQRIIADERAMLPRAEREDADVLQYLFFLLNTTEAENQQPGAQQFRVSTLLPVLKKGRRFITLDKEAATWIRNANNYTRDRARAELDSVAPLILNDKYSKRLFGAKAKLKPGVVRTNGIALHVVCLKEGEEKPKPEKNKTKKRRKEEAEEASAGAPGGFVPDTTELSAIDPGVNSVITVVFLGGGRHRNGMPLFKKYVITAKQWRHKTGHTHLWRRYHAAVQSKPVTQGAISAMSASPLRTVNLVQLLEAIHVHFLHRRTLVRVSGSRRLARLQFRVASRIRSKLARLRNWLLGSPGSDRRVAFGAEKFTSHSGRGPVLKIRDDLVKAGQGQVALVNEYRTSKASALSVFRGHNADLQQMFGDVKHRDGSITRGEVWAIKQSKKEDYTVNRDVNAGVNIWFTAVMQSRTGTNDRPVGLRRRDN